MASKIAGHANHGFPPLVYSDSKILILGSFPSVKSRQAEFYYGHPQNRFWPLLFRVFEEPFSNDIEKKKDLCKRHGIALYDSIEECDIIGSSDSSIRNVIPADIDSLIEQSQIKRILLNGKKSEECFRRFQHPHPEFEILGLPSTSPANAVWSLDALVSAWKKALS